ncbi:MAG: hypothetical protein ACLQVK_08060 [Acidimicrobiales bacterium]
MRGGSGERPRVAQAMAAGTPREGGLGDGMGAPSLDPVPQEHRRHRGSVPRYQRTAGKHLNQ